MKISATPAKHFVTNPNFLFSLLEVALKHACLHRQVMLAASPLVRTNDPFSAAVATGIELTRDFPIPYYFTCWICVNEAVSPTRFRTPCCLHLYMTPLHSKSCVPNKHSRAVYLILFND